MSPRPPLVREDEAHDLELDERLAQPERREAPRAGRRATAQTTASRWCGLRIGLTSDGSTSMPLAVASSAFASRKVV